MVHIFKVLNVYFTLFIYNFANMISKFHNFLLVACKFFVVNIIFFFRLNLTALLFRKIRRFHAISVPHNLSRIIMFTNMKFLSNGH